MCCRGLSSVCEGFRQLLDPSNVHKDDEDCASVLQNLLKALQGLVPEAGVDPFGGQAAGSRSDKGTGNRARASGQQPAPTTGSGSQL